MTVGVWKVEESHEYLRSMFQDFSIYEEGYARFTSDKRKVEWLAVRALLKELCGEEKSVSYYPSGKPYLTDGSARISFSHTQGYVAVAVHPCKEVAVDIEQYGTRVKRVAHKFIRGDEQIPAEPLQEIQALLLHWSAKETLYKLLDKEGVDFIRHLQVFPFELVEEGEFVAGEPLTEQNECFPVHYHTHPHYVLTYASRP